MRRRKRDVRIELGPRALVLRIERGQMDLENLGNGGKDLCQFCRKRGVVREPLAACLLLFHERTLEIETTQPYLKIYRS